MDVRRLNQEDFEQWARQLGVPFEHVQRLAKVKPSRATKMRLGQGGAADVRAKLLKTMTELEGHKTEHTPIGRVVLGWQEWCELGARFASLNASEFLAVLERVRKVVEGREGLHDFGVK